jgi:hypothetical protein
VRGQTLGADEVIANGGSRPGSLTLILMNGKGKSKPGRDMTETTGITARQIYTMLMESEIQALI